MKRLIGLLVPLLLAAVFSPSSHAVDWTGMVSPVDVGNYNDVLVEDINADGIMDIVAAKGHDYVTSQADGLPVWMGSVYQPTSQWYWALSSPGAPKGNSASLPIPDPDNVSNAILHRVTIGNAMIDVEDWIVSVLWETGIGQVNLGHSDGSPNVGNGTINPENPATHIAENRVNRDEVWSCVYRSSDSTWVITSPRSGAQDGFAATGVPYTSDHGEVTFVIEAGSIPFGNNDMIKFSIDTAGLHVESSTGKILEAASPPYEPRVNEYFTDWRPIAGLEVDAGFINLKIGDKFYFHVPDGPETNDQYNKVALADFNLDGYYDIAGAGKNGIKIYQQAGPSNTAVVFFPVPVHRKPLSDGWLLLNSFDSATTLTEMWYVTAVQQPDLSVIFHVTGERSGNMHDYTDWPGNNTYTSDHAEVTFSISGTYFNTGDQFRFSTIRTTWAANSGPTSSGEYLSIAEADLNHDALIDVVAGRADGGLDIWLNRYGHWELGSSPTNTEIFRELEVKDINRDGKLDLIGCTDGSGIKIWFGDGAGNWTAAVTPQSSGSYESLKVVDVNNDGTLDIVATSTARGIYVWYQKEDGTWFQKAWASLPEPGSLNAGNGTMSAVNTDNQATITEGWRVECVTAEPQGGWFKVTGDVSGEQATQAHVGELYTAPGGQVQFTIMSGTIDFIVGDFFTFITGRGPLSNNQFHDLDVSDLNNDSKVDIFAGSASEAGVMVWTGNAVFGWNLETSPITNSQYKAISAHRDMNFDGNPDVVGCNGSYGGIQVWIGNGADKFGFQSWITKPIAEGNFYAVKIAELNNDHKPDIVAANYEEGKNGVWIYYGNGGGDFTLGPSPTLVSKFYSVAVGDLNHDGYNDIVGGHSEQGVFVWLSNHDGTWAPNSGPVNTGSYWDVELADFNRDGNPDIIGCKDFDNDGGSVQIWLGNGDGTFGIGQYPVDALYSFYHVAVADFNHDSLPDFACSGYTGAGGAFWYTSSVPGAAAIDFSEGRVLFSAIGHDNFYGALTADFNLDTMPDLAFSEGGTGIYTYFQSGCSDCENIWYATYDFDTGFKQNMASADINIDGVPDLAVANLGTGISVFRCNFTGPSGVPGFSALASPTSTGDYVGLDVKDVSNDGLPDIVGAHGISGGTGIELWLSFRDFTLLRIQGTDPSPNATYNINSGAPFKITFNKQIDESTATTSNIIVTQDGSTLFGSIFISNNQTEVQYYPNQQELKANATISITVRGGFDGILDIFGNPLDGNKNGIAEASPADDYIFVFSAVDITPPAVPSNVIVIPEDHGMLIRWQANTESDLDGYWVCWGPISRFDNNNDYTTSKYYQKDQFGAPPEYRVKGLINGQTYYFAVVSQDLYGNYSPFSQEITGIPVQMAPEVLLAGYWGTSIAGGGTLRMLALVTDPQNDIASVEILYGGSPTGVLLADDGTQNDFAAGDGVYGLSIPIASGVPAGSYALELQATDRSGNTGLMWPYYYSIASAPVPPGGFFAPFAQPPRLPLPLWGYRAVTAPSPGAPEVAIGGFMGTISSQQMGGTLTILAFVTDPDGYGNIASVELYYAGAPTGLFLRDDGSQGDFGAGDGVFGITVTIPPYDVLPEGAYLLEIRATDQNGETSGLWPYLNTY